MRIRFLVPVLLIFGISSFARAQTGLAEKYFLEGRWGKAIEEYGEANRESPSVKALNRLGEAYFYAGDLRASERSFRRALEMEDNAESRIFLAMVEAVNDKDRIGDLAGLSEEYGESAFLLRAVGVALLKHGDRDGAMGNFLSAAVKDPEDYMTHFYIGLVLERRHLYDGAIKAYKRSVELNPAFAQAINNLGYCYKERRYYTYAIEKYEEAIAIEPDNAGYHYNLGNALTHKGRVREALDAYRRAVELDPAFAKAHYNLGRSYIGLDMLEEGVKELRLYLKHWDKSLTGTDAPSPGAVKSEIELLEGIIEERKKG